MNNFVTGDHFDVDFFLNHGCTYVFHDDAFRPWYEFEVTDDLIDIWRVAKERYSEAALAELAGASELAIYKELHRPVRRPPE